MSYLSASENVGFSGIPQNISDASCATQYKMAVEGVSGCNDVNMFIHDNSADEQTYITQFNDNFYTKFKIDPSELYTFHDSDVVAGEITVSHTEDAYTFDSDEKSKLTEVPNNDSNITLFTNGDVSEVKSEIISNGHYPKVSKPAKAQARKDIKTTHTKVSKTKSQAKEPIRKDLSTEVRRLSAHSPNSQSSVQPTCDKNSINSVNTNNANTSATKQSSGETFLDVFKREQGLVENSQPVVKTEPTPVIKVPTSPPKKASSGKIPSQSKARRGRGPAVHEALQRIPAQQRAIPIPCKTWHAPGDSLFSCGPLDDKRSAFRQLESSSSDDDNMPDFVSGYGSACVEENAVESRGARLALRRAALRRHVARARASLQLANNHRDHQALASLIKKQLNGQSTSSHLPTQTVNHLLAMRGMPAVLTSHERRRLRENGWSGGESGSAIQATGGSGKCEEDRCGERAVACSRYCLAHVTLSGEQRLYAACAAVFAGGARCRHPLLPLHDQTPLCAEHAWKRDNYDKLSRDPRPKKVVRARVVTTGGRAPRRAKKRRRAPARPPRPPAHPPAADHSLSEMNVCSNSSTYDSSEDTAVGALSESEYIAVASNSNQLVEVGHVPPDDILDPVVLSQISDEAFTEFFNHAEVTTPFAESSELAAALEAVLDERALDTIADCVFTHSPHAQQHRTKMPVPNSVPMEMSSSAPS